MSRVRNLKGGGGIKNLNRQTSQGEEREGKGEEKNILTDATLTGSCSHRCFFRMEHRLYVYLMQTSEMCRAYTEPARFQKTNHVRKSNR